MKSALLVADADNRLHTLPGATAAVDAGVTQWAYDKGQAAGRGTAPCRPARRWCCH